MNNFRFRVKYITSKSDYLLIEKTAKLATLVFSNQLMYPLMYLVGLIRGVTNYQNATKFEFV